MPWSYGAGVVGEVCAGPMVSHPSQEWHGGAPTRPLKRNGRDLKQGLDSVATPAHCLLLHSP